ncbi:hypothetical protein PQU92_05475 [Asticcacaulis sp. BYS171W]|uniref:Lipoprotein n=1 Tax=Asticcacaulis aquaticus TaxID=2984212 RepID=A0ABT5HTA5_9CAUL|nr:hypothetical protein [Asticcacaulis aquaticus]MDC7682716.1 hypothetical protein [Asticcacaulis aquaticus]
MSRIGIALCLLLLGGCRVDFKPPRHLPPLYGESAHLTDRYYIARQTEKFPVARAGDQIRREPGDLSLCRWNEPPEGDCTAVVPGKVLALGFDEHYLVVKQAVEGHVSYFVIDLAADTADQPHAGALSEVEFQKQVKAKALPAFASRLPRLKVGKAGPPSEI